jgi:hypothetical protein
MCKQRIAADAARMGRRILAKQNCAYRTQAELLELPAIPAQRSAAIRSGHRFFLSIYLGDLELDPADWPIRRP